MQVRLGTCKFCKSETRSKQLNREVTWCDDCKRKRPDTKAAYVPVESQSFLCSWCSGPFELSGKQLSVSSRYSNHFCSALCRSRWRYTVVKPPHHIYKNVCDRCTGTFESRNKNKFCQSCRDNYIPVNVRGHHGRAVHFGVEYVTGISRNAVMERFAWHCGLCDKPINPFSEYPSAEYGTIDHIVPMSKGGPHTWANVQAAHLGCNLSKGNTTKTKAG